MTTHDNALAQQRLDRQLDQFGARIAARLTEGAQATPHDIGERLRVARQMALAQHKRSVQPAFQPTTASHVQVNGVSRGTASLSLGKGSGRDDHPGWWTRLGALLPLVALVTGLFVINAVSNDNRARELAEVDAALLTDDLPPAAYVDPGFAQFVKQQPNN